MNDNVVNVWEVIRLMYKLNKIELLLLTAHIARELKEYDDPMALNDAQLYFKDGKWHKR